MDVLTKLREQRKAAVDAMKDINSQIEAALVEDSDADVAELQARFATTEAEYSDTDSKIEAAEKRAAVIAAAPVEAVQQEERKSPSVQITNQPLTYDKADKRSTGRYFRDLARAEIDKDGSALERLSSHAKEMRDLSRTDGSGGYFVPPVQLTEAIGLQRAGRVTADLIGSLDLPLGIGDTFTMPKISTGTATAAQTADNAAVQETDLTDSQISVSIKTVAGQQDVSMQALEQSMPSLDNVIADDLAADYNTKLDGYVISGSGASGQPTGILNTGSILSVTYTDASPTVPELYPKVADGIQQINAARYMAPTAIIMSPRRWGWFTAALDTTNRPLVVPNAGYNPVAAQGAVAAEAFVGTLQGLPVYVDANIPTNLGGSTNEDRIIICRKEDYRLFESELRTRVLPEVGSGTLTVRFQVYGYMAFTAARYPSSTAVISGTGLVTPTF